ncbi:hypothetical protein L5515_011539 [Caenorhabditis briggsae]|uniref:Uncharacterized protein n=1 Tax=Caenorhabditis briggsae TaxID=6238 RepID=A0AAE9EXQ0_CAEBR|nr:hypothetical protein L5515_011539 [Caenorhabditis briggsae]
MLERLCATYYIQDYEKKQRPWIGYILIAFLYSSALFTEYIVDFKSEYFVTFSTVHLIINGISYGILLWTYRLNRSYYFENRVVKHTYSLGERYQISENIRIHKYFTRYLFVIAFFTSACGIIMIAALLSARPFQRMLIAMFDLSYILLTIFAPYFSLQMSESFQNEYDLILLKMGIRRQTKVLDIFSEKARKLKNTFGEQMNFESSRHSDVYFEQFRKAWSREVKTPQK